MSTINVSGGEGKDESDKQSYFQMGCLRLCDIMTILSKSNICLS